MKIVTDQKKIARGKKIGQYTTFGSLAVLALGMYMAFQEELMIYSFIPLIVGFIASQLGTYYTTKFSLSPRPDEQLSAALKGLDNKYTLYHYMSAVPHLLVGPAGIWILNSFHQGGTITYDEKQERWKQKGGNVYLKIFGQESLGRPGQQVRSYEKDFGKFLEENLSEIELPKVQSALVFTNEKTIIEADNAPSATLPIKKLKDHMRRIAKNDPAPQEIINLIQKALPQEDIEAPVKK